MEAASSGGEGGSALLLHSSAHHAAAAGVCRLTKEAAIDGPVAALQLMGRDGSRGRLEEFGVESPGPGLCRDLKMEEGKAILDGRRVVGDANFRDEPTA